MDFESNRGNPSVAQLMGSATYSNFVLQATLEFSFLHIFKAMTGKGQDMVRNKWITKFFKTSFSIGSYSLN